MGKHAEKKKAACPDPTQQQERRSAPRYPFNPDTSCQVMAVDEPSYQPAELKDISTTGVRLIAAQRHQPGSVLTLTLSRSDGRWQRTLMLRVVHDSTRSDGKHTLGCAFLTPLRGHELLSLTL